MAFQIRNYWQDEATLDQQGVSWCPFRAAPDVFSMRWGLRIRKNVVLTEYPRKSGAITTAGLGLYDVNVSGDFQVARQPSLQSTLRLMQASIGLRTRVVQSGLVDLQHKTSDFVDLQPEIKRALCYRPRVNRASFMVLGLATRTT